MVLIFVGMVANIVIARALYGDDGRIFLSGSDWMGDFIKHVMSFPGAPLAPSVLPNLITHFQEEAVVNASLLGHFHNMPLTVFLTLLVRPALSAFDPVMVYAVVASAHLLAWAWVNHRFAHKDARPQALGLALFSYPVFMMLERGNLFAAITAICLLVALCRRKQDLTAAVLLALAANIRPNVAILVVPLLAFDRASLVFLLKTAAVGSIVALGCLAVDNAIYPAYHLSSILAGLALYNAGYVIGPFALNYTSSLWGAVRHFAPATGLTVTLCTLVGLVPLGLAWFNRNRLSYASACFLAIGACTLSTSIFADYHLMIFTVPILLVKREDRAYWPIVLGACWMLIPKHYTPMDELSWQIYLNPVGLIVAIACILALNSCRGALPSSPSDKPPTTA